jgi:cold shock CspA family protein
MPRGHISRLFPDRGYGFIEEEAHTDEVEFHWTALQGLAMEQLRPGQYVEFEKVIDHRSPDRERAVAVRLIERGAT